MSGGSGMLSRMTEAPPSCGLVRCATQAHAARTSPSTMNSVTPSRRPHAHCWASTPEPAARNFSVAATASAGSTTSTGTMRLSDCPVHDVVGLSTKGKSNSASTAGSSSMLSSRIVFGWSMPSLCATSSVRSLSLAISSAASGARASTQPSEASWSRTGIRAAMVPSPLGRTTRVGWSRTKSRTASANARPLPAQLGKTTLRAE